MSQNPNLYYGWQFLPEGGCLPGAEPQTPVVVGERYRADLATRRDGCGLFAAERAIGALSGAHGPIIARVVLDGAVQRYADEARALELRVLGVADAASVLHEFAIRCAEDVLDMVGDARPRCVAAIAMKRRWLRGEVTEADLIPALDAVALAVARAETAQVASARVAAGAGAGVSARQAAWHASHAAAGAALNRSAAYTKYNGWLEEALFELLGLDPETGSV